MMLLDIRMADGTRHFGGLPETQDPDQPQWHRLRDHVDHLAGAELTGFTTDDATEAWIDFTHRRHAFSINNQRGQWSFFVDDPACPDDILTQVLAHFEELLAAEHG